MAQFIPKSNFGAKVLNLSHNALTRFEDQWRYNWLGLQVLDLSYNKFSGRISSRELNFVKFDPGKFYLDLSYNNIEQITAEERLPEENIQENPWNIQEERQKTTPEKSEKKVKQSIKNLENIRNVGYLYFEIFDF